MAGITIVYGEYIVLKKDGYSKFLPWHRLHAIELREGDGVAKVYGDGINEMFTSDESGYETIRNYSKNLGNNCKRLIN